MKRTNKILVSLLTGVLLVVLCACGGGGGGGGGSTPPPPPPPPPLTITSSTLPQALQAHAYSATLTATGGVGAFKWSISTAPGQQFPTGLSVDANTGVLSGTADFLNFGSFTAQVSDSQGHSASKLLLIISNPPLSATTTDLTVSEYSNLDLTNGIPLNLAGGIGPLALRIVGGTLPAGLHLNPSRLSIAGSAFQVGTFAATLEVTDSYSPPEIVTAQVNVKVVPAQLFVANSLPSRLPLNVPFSGRVVVRGGTRPYSFSLPTTNALPPGMSLDAATGAFSGTPTQAGFWSFFVDVKDSSTPAQTIRGFFSGTTEAACGRNDTPATATPYTGGVISGSISPYIDPPNGAPTIADGDYYKITAAAGLTVNLATGADSVLDTVLEVVDGNGIRYSTCRQSGVTAAVFNTACINDDVSATPHITSSALDFQVPGAAGSATTFYAHVIDFRGDARPDMRYSLFVNGANPPLVITTRPLRPADVGVAYSEVLTGSGGSGPGGIYSWSIASGTLPPGITFNQFGSFSGASTSTGSFTFTVQVTDTSNPPQVATAQFTINVFPALAITSPPTWPDACVNQPYSFTAQATGGATPLAFTLFPALSLQLSIDQSTGVVSGTPTTTGLIAGQLLVQDASGGFVFQSATLNVKTCP